MGIFQYNTQYKAQVAKIDGILLCCQEAGEGYEQKAREFTIAYKNQLIPLAEFILEEIFPICERMELKDLINALGTPMIDLDRNLISYLEPSLDGGHIIEVVFGGLLDCFFRVSVDG